MLYKQIRYFYLILFLIINANIIFSQVVQQKKWKIGINCSLENLMGNNLVNGTIPFLGEDILAKWNNPKSSFGLSLEYLMKNRFSINLISGINFRDYDKFYDFGGDLPDNIVYGSSHRKLRYFINEISIKHYFKFSNFSFLQFLGISSSTANFKKDNVFNFKKNVIGFLGGIGFEYRFFKNYCLALNLSYNYHPFNFLKDDQYIIKFNNLRFGLTFFKYF